MKKTLAAVLTIIMVTSLSAFTEREVTASSEGFLAWKSYKTLYDDFLSFELPATLYPGDSKYLYFFLVTPGSLDEVLVPSDAAPIFICDVTGSQSNSLSIRSANEEAFIWDQPEGLWVIHVYEWATGKIQVEVEGQLYAIPVSIEFPEDGFSSSSDISGFISSFSFVPNSQQVFYYIIPEETRVEWRNVIPRLNNRNIEIVTNTEEGSESIRAEWGGNRRFIKFTITESPLAFSKIAIGITQNYAGNIYSYIHHSGWFDIIDDSPRIIHRLHDYDLMRPISRFVNSLNSSDFATLTLTQAGGDKKYVQTAIKPTSGSDSIIQSYTINNIEPGRYTLEISNNEHEVFTVDNLIVGYLFYETSFEADKMTTLFDGLDLYVIWRSGLNENQLDLKVVWLPTKGEPVQEFED